MIYDYYIIIQQILSALDNTIHKSVLKHVSNDISNDNFDTTNPFKRLVRDGQHGDSDKKFDKWNPRLNIRESKCLRRRKQNNVHIGQRFVINVVIS